MIAQYEIAGYVGGLVIGTDHSAKKHAGFYTKHGDGACDLAPLFGLNKRQVRELAATLGAPELLVKKVTADLKSLIRRKPTKRHWTFLAMDRRFPCGEEKKSLKMCQTRLVASTKRHNTSANPSRRYLRLIV